MTVKIAKARIPSPTCEYRGIGLKCEGSVIGDIWTFSVNGIERSRRSLDDACKAIDDALHRAGKKKFKRFQAYHASAGGWHGGESAPTEVTVTSVDMTNPRSPQVWISYKNDEGKNARRRVYPHSLYEDTPENWRILSKLADLADQIKSCRDDMQRLRESLRTITLDLGDDDEETD